MTEENKEAYHWKSWHRAAAEGESQWTHRRLDKVSEERCYNEAKLTNSLGQSSRDKSAKKGDGQGEDVDHDG